MGTSSKGGGAGMSSPMYGGYGGYGNSAPPNPLFSGYGAPSSAPQFYQPSLQGLVPGLGSGSMQGPYNPATGGYYGGDALGTAGQLLSGGAAPSFNPSAGGNPQGIGYFGPTANGAPSSSGAAGAGKGGGMSKGGAAGTPPPNPLTGSGMGAPGAGGGKGGKGGSATPPPPTGTGAAPPPATAPGASAPPAAGAAGSPPSWSAAQLAQANGLSPGLADFLYAHDQGNPGAGQQFMQAAGFANPAGSQTAINQAGRNWVMNNDQSYGDINADTGQPAATTHMGFGLTANGTPYSYDRAQTGGNALQKWAQLGGATPTGVTLYNQLGPSGSQSGPSAQAAVPAEAPQPSPTQTNPHQPSPSVQSNNFTATGVHQYQPGVTGGTPLVYTPPSTPAPTVPGVTPAANPAIPPWILQQPYGNRR